MDLRAFRVRSRACFFAVSLFVYPWSELAAAGAEDLPRRVYTTQRIVGEPPKIDGKLDDPAWQQGEWAGDFLQREPFEGAAPTEPTEIKILYDNRNLYVAMRAHDSDLAPGLLGQRDEFVGDLMGFALDSYLNRSTAFEFDVTAGGNKIDLILRNDGTTDTNWTAVWDVQVGRDQHGWMAEFRIPLSQLRYSSAKEQVWGLHSSRWLRRKQESSNWHLIPMDNPGVVRSFGELRGIVDLPPSRRIELLPYLVGRYESLSVEPGNPYRDGPESSIDAGLDAKFGLTTDLTLDLTINPDFGQVEADPSEINLGTTETFLSEKRPFFVEGKNLFDFWLDDDVAFYTRRLGQAPSLVPVGSGYAQVPTNTRILSAEKITGRTASGLSLGLLHGVTEKTEAKMTDIEGLEWTSIAEPLTNYAVARVQQDFAGGDTIVGGFFSGVQREGSDETLSILPRLSLVGGADITHYWDARTYYLELRTLGTRVSGSPQAIEALSTTWVHNFQRVDADHVDLDDDATVLTGHAGRFRIGKGSNGPWRYYGGLGWRSPGVDFNDAGYLANADWIEQSVQLQYYSAEPGTFLRRRDYRLRQNATKNFGGETLNEGLRFQADIAGLSNWASWNEIGVQTARLDTRMLRGGPAVRRPTMLHSYTWGQTDGSRDTQLEWDAGYHYYPEENARWYKIAPKLARRFGGRLRVAAGVNYERNQQHSQYAGQAPSSRGTDYFVADMDQKVLSTELRVTANFSPTLSLTYFGGPFVSVGRYDEFKVVANPRSSDPDERYAQIDAWRTDTGYGALVNGEEVTFDNPDFSWRELKSNLVFKWEFSPGSTFYAVWSQHRADAQDIGEFAPRDEFRRLFSAHPDNTFLVKISYWFSI